MYALFPKLASELPLTGARSRFLHGKLIEPPSKFSKLV